MSDNPFLKALDVLRERGWTQGVYQAPTGEVCAMGALGVALCGDALRWLTAPTDDPIIAAERTLRDEVRHRYTHVQTFNDDPGTSFEDVVLAFKHAAEKWEAEQ